MSRVVGLTRGVELPEGVFIPAGPIFSDAYPSEDVVRLFPFKCGLLGAVGAGVSFFAIVAPVKSGRPLVPVGLRWDGGGLKLSSGSAPAPFNCEWL